MNRFHLFRDAFLAHIEHADANYRPRLVAANNVGLTLATIALGKSPTKVDDGHEALLTALELLARGSLDELQTALVYQMAYATFSPARQHQPLQCISSLSFTTYLSAIRVAAEDLLTVGQAQVERELVSR